MYSYTWNMIILESISLHDSNCITMHINVHDVVSCIPFLKLWHNDFNCNVFLYIIFKTTTELKHNPNNYIYLYRDIMVPNCKTNEMNYHEYSIWIPIHTNITVSTKTFSTNDMMPFLWQKISRGLLRGCLGLSRL